MSNKLDKLKQMTQARILQARSGHAVTTVELLKYHDALREARDAVFAKWDNLAMAQAFSELGEKTIVVSSGVKTRQDYLQRPDLGRTLNNASCMLLSEMRLDADVVFIISDGLSARAIEAHGLSLWRTIRKALSPLDLKIAPLVLAPFSRVALSDHIGFYLNAKIAVMLVGERPGLSASDSLGIYLTYAPKPGNQDADRNCISNIRPPHGLTYAAASEKLMLLLRQTLRLRCSGVSLAIE